ncbi:MAG: amidohydrolase family protein [Planctomycetota bacterium]|jgi:predicted TIM-barrel fold metal-dependent hydrolase
MTPVIDVHAHVFNGMDIPLKGYLLSRSPDGFFEKTLLPLLAPSIARALRREMEPEESRGLFTRIKSSVVLNLAYLALGKQVRGWAETLVKSVEEITTEMLDTYDEDSIDLFVPLMFDYEYWFLNTPDTPMVEQIDRMAERIVIPHRGRIHPFVPFDPARELAFRKGLPNPDGEPEAHGSLALVKDAVENRGFIGVKVYNAMGYKPALNATVERERLRLPLHDSIYRFSGEEYDEVLEELYRFCVDREVPVTAHCFMDGMESYRDASWDFGQARFWRPVLERPEFRTLRLNLAHFGWNKEQPWDGDRSWVRDVCEMTGEFEFLYADSGHHRVILPDKRHYFERGYREIFEAHPHVKKKLLFGIDWHVVKRVKNFGNFKRAYESVLRGIDGFSEADLSDFLGGNALRFLGLTAGGENRKRLSRFYEAKSIDPPAWFREAGEVTA